MRLLQIVANKIRAFGRGLNRPFSYYRYKWTGPNFQLSLMGGIFSNANHSGALFNDIPPQ